MQTCEILTPQISRSFASPTTRALRFFRFGTGSSKPTREGLDLPREAIPGDTDQNQTARESVRYRVRFRDHFRYCERIDGVSSD